MKIAKFGGSSVATASQIKKVCDIIISDPERRLVVVSAPGKSCDEDTKVTDLLIACANAYLANENVEREINAVFTRYQEIAHGLNLSNGIINEIAKDLHMRLQSNADNPGRLVDALKASGEDNCAKLIAAYLRSIDVDATYIDPKEAGMLLSDEYGNARLLPESYTKLKKLKDKSGIMIFPGFFGYTPDGTLVTFSRGGSDITGSILAAAVDASLYENFTDVDSVFVANPKVVSNPKAIPNVTYREMRELAYAGFTVLHEETLVPVYKAGIPVCIKNTNNPSAPGTLITKQHKAVNSPVTGIACDSGFCSINVRKFLMNREIGFGRKILQILEDEGISYEHSPSGIDDMSIVLKQKQLRAGTEERILKRIQDELDVDDVYIEYDLALIIIVGEGMFHRVGVAATATSAIANAGISLEMINQGSSEISMMFAVKADNSDDSVRAIYQAFFEKH